MKRIEWANERVEPMPRSWTEHDNPEVRGGETLVDLF
jgi:hypothetical protein